MSRTDTRRSLPLFVSLVLCLDLIVLDQISKWWVSEYIFKDQGFDTLLSWVTNPPARLPFTSIDVLPFFNLVMVWNEGISFGLFNDGSGGHTLWLSLFTLILSLVFLGMLIRAKHLLQQVSLLLIVSGALGNLIDRLRFGAVIDFIDIHVAGHHWPAFNAADSFICLGVALLLIYTLFYEPTTSSKGTNI